MLLPTFDSSCAIFAFHPATFKTLFDRKTLAEDSVKLFFEVGSFTLHQISNSSSWLLPRSWGLIEVGNTFLFRYS